MTFAIKRLARLLILTLTTSGFIISSANASPGLNFSTDGATAQSRYTQRKLYQQLVNDIRSSQTAKYEKSAGRLADYPLYPYLEYSDKVYRLSRQSESDIRQFIETYETTPLANQLRQKYLANLAKKKSWRTFARIYSDSDATYKNRCYYPYALYRSGRKSEALNIAGDLWLVGKSQPKACDPIFKIWQASGRLTQELAWDRFILAMGNGELKLATYLKRFLSANDQSLASQYQTAYQRPSRLKQTHRFKRTDDKSKTVIAHLIKRRAGSNASDALKILGTYRKTHAFDEEVLDKLYTYIAVRLSRSSDTLSQLTQIPIDLSGKSKVIEAQIRTALKQLDYGEALVQIYRLSKEDQTEDRWQYWKARILLGSSSFDDITAAHAMLAALAGKRSYYGFMAADIQETAYDFEHQSVAVTQDEILNLSSHPGMQRAFELFALGQIIPAGREWRLVTKDFNVTELQVAAKLAEQWGWHAMSIQAMIQAKSWDDLDIRFPTAFLDNFLASSRAADIPVVWSLAIARQESAFRPAARSRAGAIGLMQLLYSTAQETANKEGIKLTNKRHLTDPDINIQLGTAYLGQMLRRFDYNRIIASAAYNAGPGRVNRWINNELPLDIWIETIPYNETRSYVINVLTFSAIYNHRLDKTAPMIFEHERKRFSAWRSPIETASSRSPSP